VKILLDTHAFLWFITDDAGLSSKAKEAFIDAENDLYLSMGSIWEMCIKTSLGKLESTLPINTFIPQQIKNNGIRLLAIEMIHCLKVATLPFHHRDPFDRLLIAQCLSENWPIISVDSQLDQYGVTRIWR